MGQFSVGDSQRKRKVERGTLVHHRRVFHFKASQASGSKINIVFLKKAGSFTAFLLCVQC